MQGCPSKQCFFSDTVSADMVNTELVRYIILLYLSVKTSPLIVDVHKYVSL